MGLDAAMVNITDPEGNVTGFEYDALLRLVTKTLPTLDTESYYYGANSGSGAFSRRGWQPTRVTNPRGFHTDTVYDKAYRAVETVRRCDPANPQPEPAVTTRYNLVHNRTAETVLNEDADGSEANRVTFTFYDSLHRPTAAVVDMDGDGAGVAEGEVVDDPTDPPAGAAWDADDLVTMTAYDMAGNVKTTTDAEGVVTWNDYDGAGRLVQTVQDAGDPLVADDGLEATTVSVYDPNGNKIRVRDPRSNWTRLFYDRRNLLVRTVVDMNGNATAVDDQGFADEMDISTRTEYDLAGNAVTEIDARGNATDKDYDRANRLRYVTGPEVADAEDAGAMTQPVTETVYDHNSNVTHVIDPRGVTTRTVFRMTYQSSNSCGGAKGLRQERSRRRGTVGGVS